MTARPPSAEQQVRFLQDIQRLLGEGQFTATYKFALLHALADLSVLKGDDSGAPLTLTTYEIAEKFVELYWRQAMPIPWAAGHTHTLIQNTDRQAAVINAMVQVQGNHGRSLGRLRSDSKTWGQVVKKVEGTVKVQPLWKLQILGGEPYDFLYEHIGRGNAITLQPGVAYCFRRFHGLLIDLFRGAWVRHLRRIAHNHGILGAGADLTTFLFGAERESLAEHKTILDDVQAGRCFYCGDNLRGGGDVDHFVPWSRYPYDLGHNFVLAHPTCNNYKSDQMAAEEHLERWVARNDEHEAELQERFGRRAIVHDLGASLRVARWAYSQTANAGGLVWLRKRTLVDLEDVWRELL